MDPTLFEAMFEINAAIAMVAVSVAIFVWFQRSEAAASARRMIGMMTRVGLGHGSPASDDPRAGVVMKETRQRCRRCPREDFCERWLAGDVEGGNAFCRNADILRVLAEAGGYSA